MLKQMSIAGMILEDDEKSFYLLLKEMEGPTIISVQIDQLQAESIAIAMDTAFTRIPDPYEFISNIMESFELKISKVIIKNTARFTKSTDVFLTDGEKEIRIYSRIGDAVASALHFDAPIFMDTDFFGSSDKNSLKQWLDNITPGDFG